MTAKLQALWNPTENPIEGDVIVAAIEKNYDADEMNNLVDDGPFLVELLIPANLNPYDHYEGREKVRVGNKNDNCGYDCFFEFHSIHPGKIFRVVSYMVKIERIVAYI